MQSICAGTLAGVCVVMLLADAMLSLAYVRYAPKDNDWPQVLFMALIILPLNLPYLGAWGSSLTPLNRHPRLHWLFAVMVVGVAVLSLALRYADYTVARSVWEAHLAGTHFGFCAPPPRLVAVLVDFIGVGLALASAGAIALITSRAKVSGKR